MAQVWTWLGPHIWLNMPTASDGAYFTWDLVPLGIPLDAKAVLLQVNNINNTSTLLTAIRPNTRAYERYDGIRANSVNFVYCKVIGGRIDIKVAQATSASINIIAYAAGDSPTVWFDDPINVLANSVANTYSTINLTPYTSGQTAVAAFVRVRGSDTQIVDWRHPASVTQYKTNMAGLTVFIAQTFMVGCQGNQFQFFRQNAEASDQLEILGYATAGVDWTVSSQLNLNPGATAVWETKSLGSGSGGGVVSNIPADALNVTAAPYSAVGNGSTNNQTAIQNCINAAKAAGKAVYIPPGNFAHQGMFTVDNVQIYGAGPELTTLHALETVNESAVMLTGNNTGTASIEGVKITGVPSVRNSNIKTAAILVRACDGFSIKNCTVQGSPPPGSGTGISGIFVYGGKNGYIGYNTITGTRNDSIHMTIGKTLDGNSTYTTNDILVERNNISYSNDDGVACVSGTLSLATVVERVEARFNTVFGQFGGRGMTVVGSRDCYYHDNYIEGGPNGRAGVMIAAEDGYNSPGNENFRLINNTIRTAGGTSTGHGAIHVYNSWAIGQTQYRNRNITIQDNDVFQAKKDAVVINGSGINDLISLVNNRFYAPTSGNGVVLVGSPTNITQAGNQILTAGAYTGDKVPITVGVGSGADWGSSVDVQGVVIRAGRTQASNANTIGIRGNASRPLAGFRNPTFPGLRHAQQYVIWNDPAGTIDTYRTTSDAANSFYYVEAVFTNVVTQNAAVNIPPLMCLGG